MHILVVEDSKDVAYLLDLILSRELTDRVTVCSDRFEGLRDEVDWREVDVIVCDRFLGDYDGADLLGWLSKAHPRIYRIMLTGSSDALEEEVHAERVLLKPVDPDVLMQAVRSDV